MMWFFCFKQKTAYEMRSSDWSSDVGSSDLGIGAAARIRIGDRDRAEARTRRLERQSLVGIDQRIVFGRVTVRPAIDRDAGDVACRIEAAARQRAAEQIGRAHV